MKKTFDHAVIYDGVFYPANTEITVKEVKDDKKVTEENTVTETPKKKGAK